MSFSAKRTHIHLSLHMSSTILQDLANSRPVHSLMLSSQLFFCLLLFFPLSLCLARQFWPDTMNWRHVHTTSLRWSRGLRMVRFFSKEKFCADSLLPWRGLRDMLLKILLARSASSLEHNSAISEQVNKLKAINIPLKKSCWHKSTAYKQTWVWGEYRMHRSTPLLRNLLWTN